MREPKKGATLLLAVYSLNQQGAYIHRVITFKSDIDCDVELSLCLREAPNGEPEITLEDSHLSADIPKPPEPDETPPPVIRLEATEHVHLRSNWSLPPLPPTLPENPTATERWKYLVAVLKQKADKV